MAALLRLFFVVDFYLRGQNLYFVLVLLFGQEVLFVEKLDHFELSLEQVFVVVFLLVLFHFFGIPWR